MTCAFWRDRLEDYSLAQLPENERQPMAAHLAECADCREALADVEATWSLMSFGLALQPVEPAVFSRVIERIRREPALTPKTDVCNAPVTPPAVSTPTRQPWSKRWPSYALAICVSLLLAALFLRGIYRESWENQVALSPESIRNHARAIADQMGKLERLERTFAAPRLQYVSFRDVRSTAKEVRAYVIWDVAAHQWHFFAFTLAPPKPGFVHQLWLVTRDGKTIPAGRFQIDPQGMAGMVVDLPAKPVSIVEAIVTEEPAGGSSSPSGPVRLAASIPPP